MPALSERRGAAGPGGGARAPAIALAVAAAAIAACANPPPPEAPAPPPAAHHAAPRAHHPAGHRALPRGDARPGEIVRGYATWYGGGLDGGPTASGERFDKRKLTAASRTLPFGTIVRVTRDGTDRSVTVRINDRGPWGKDRRRIIDLSEAAARELGMIAAGVAPVTIEVLSRPAHR